MNANDMQVGGTHYRVSFQHWDLVWRLRLGYFEGQITKYVTRHRKKHGRQDLEKALHFLRKMLELVQRGYYFSPALVRVPVVGSAGAIDDYVRANGLDDLEDKVVRRVCLWRFYEELAEVVPMIEELLKRYVAPTDGVRIVLREELGEAGPGYVNQDGRDC